jgi:hypothetical protein
MKKLIGFIVSLLLLSCSTKLQNDEGDMIEANSIEACGCIHPQENLPWLKELIQKAEKDNTSNYLGCIWLEKTSAGKDIFVTNMMLGSGGVLYWFFDCEGNHYVFPGVEKCVACEYVGNNHVFFDNEFSIPEITKKVVVYSPHDLGYICK